MIISFTSKPANAKLLIASAAWLAVHSVDLPKSSAVFFNLAKSFSVAFDNALTRDILFSNVLPHFIITAVVAAPTARVTLISFLAIEIRPLNTRSPILPSPIRPRPRNLNGVDQNIKERLNLRKDFCSFSIRFRTLPIVVMKALALALTFTTSEPIRAIYFFPYIFDLDGSSRCAIL